MDKIEKICQEIERRIRELDEQIVDIYDSKAVLRKDELQRLLSFLSTLESEEPDKSLEEEVKNYFQGYWPRAETAEQWNTDLHFTPPAIIRLARHFAKWQKEQMMKDAVEYEVMDFSSSLEPHPHVYIPLDNKKYRPGDTVRIIVLPKEEEK